MDTVRGVDDPPRATVNEEGAGGRFEVTATDGVSIDSDESSGHYAKGDIVKLDRDSARALLGEGSIKEASE